MKYLYAQANSFSKHSLLVLECSAKLKTASLSLSRPIEVSRTGIRKPSQRMLARVYGRKFKKIPVRRVGTHYVIKRHLLHGA